MKHLASLVALLTLGAALAGVTIAGCQGSSGGAPAPTIETVAGDGREDFSGDGRPATLASLQHPQDVAVDADGVLYIADTDNHRIRTVDLNGVITTLAGDGTAGFGGDGGPSTGAQLFQPQGVDVDEQGNVYVADTENNRIRKIDAGGTITTIAGTGEAGFGGDGGPATAALLFHPTRVRVDGHRGDLYVVDARNQRIRRIRAGVIETVAGDGQPGFSDLGSATGSSFRFASNFYRLGDVAVDADGNLYVADSGNHYVRKVTPNDDTEVIAGTGTFSAGGDDGPAIAAGLSLPAGIAVHPSGDLLISDTVNQDLRRCRADGSLIWHVAGVGFPDTSGDGGPARDGGLRAPMGLAVDSSTGAIYVADTENNRIRRISR